MLSATACTDCNLLLYQNPDLAITFLLSRWESTFGRGRTTLLKVTLTIAGHRRSLVLLTSSRPPLWGWKFADMQKPAHSPGLGAVLDSSSHFPPDLGRMAYQWTLIPTKRKVNNGYSRTFTAQTLYVVARRYQRPAVTTAFCRSSMTISTSHTTQGDNGLHMRSLHVVRRLLADLHPQVARKACLRGVWMTSATAQRPPSRPSVGNLRAC